MRMKITDTPDQVSPCGLALVTGVEVQADVDEEVVVEVVLTSRRDSMEAESPRPGALLLGAWADSETVDGAGLESGRSRCPDARSAMGQNADPEREGVRSRIDW